MKAAKAGRRRASALKRPSLLKAAPRRRSTATTQETDTARLARERDEALERERATAEVLHVIKLVRPGDLDPVFKVMLENSTRRSRGRIRRPLAQGGRSLSASSQCTMRRRRLSSCVGASLLSDHPVPWAH